MPTARITRSTVMSSVLPLASTATVTLSAPLRRLPALPLVMMRMPCFSNCLRAKAEISSSSTGRMRSITSTTVTLAPSSL